MPSSPPRSKSISTIGRVQSRASSRRKDSATSEPMPFFPRTTLTPEEQTQLYEAPMPERIDGTWPNLAVPDLTDPFSNSERPAAGFWDERRSACMSSMSSMPSLRQAANQHPSSTQRRPNGLKATIKRVFGSKRHRTLVDEAYGEYHISDPGSIMNPERTSNHHLSTPVSSSHRTAAQRNASSSRRPDPSSDVRDFGTTHPEQPPLKRRNTVPNMDYEEPDAQCVPETPSPGSIAKEEDDVVQTIRKNSTFSDRDKHRSKSTNALSDKYLTDGQSSDDRLDQQSDIGLWRSSIMLTALPKSTQHDSDETIQESLHHDIQHVPSLEHIIKSSHSSDFGLNTYLHQPVDLEERVNTLEVKMFDFEYAIAKLQGVEVPKPLLPTRQSKRKNVQEAFSRPSIRSLSTATSGNDRAPITPVDTPVSGSPLKESFPPDRSSKATTIRPLIRSKSAPRGSLRLTADQFESLMTLIQDEKDARQLMELQIVELQREIELLHSPIYATINYPDPDLEPHRGSAQKKLHRSPPFQLDRPLVRETSRFSMTESEADSIDNTFSEKFELSQQAVDFDQGRSPLIGVVV